MFLSNYTIQNLYNSKVIDVVKNSMNTLNVIIFGEQKCVYMCSFMESPGASYEEEKSLIRKM